MEQVSLQLAILKHKCREGEKKFNEIDEKLQKTDKELKALSGAVCCRTHVLTKKISRQMS